MKEDDNADLMEVISEEELNVVLSNFKKDKIPGPDGWTIEFFWVYLILLGEICRKLWRIHVCLEGFLPVLRQPSLN